MGLVSEFAGSESCIYFSASVKNVGWMICVCLASCIKNFTAELCWDFTLDRRCFAAVCQVSECTGSKICVFLFNLRKKCEYCNDLCLASCQKRYSWSLLRHHSGSYPALLCDHVSGEWMCWLRDLGIFIFSLHEKCEYLMMCVSGQLCQKLYSWTFLRWTFLRHSSYRGHVSGEWVWVCWFWDQYFI